MLVRRTQEYNTAEHKATEIGIMNRNIQISECFVVIKRKTFKNVSLIFTFIAEYDK